MDPASEHPSPSLSQKLGFPKMLLKSGFGMVPKATERVPCDHRILLASAEQTAEQGENFQVLSSPKFCYLIFISFTSLGQFSSVVLRETQGIRF